MRRRVQRASAHVALGLAALVAGCGAPSPPRHVLLFVVDTLRADHLGSYGYERNTSPHIDGFARDAVLFRHPLSPSPWTLPAMATLMTSLYPSVHGAVAPSRLQDVKWLFLPDEFRPASALHPSRATLAERLREEGFRTAGFVRGSYPSAVFGMDQGFELYADNETPGVRFDVERALQWIDEEQPERFFVYIHVVEVHAPYTPPEILPRFERLNPNAPNDYYAEAIHEEAARMVEVDFDPDYQGTVDGSLGSLTQLERRGREVPDADVQALVALYDRGITYVDHYFGKLVDGLRSRELYDDTLIIVTSDHGEEFLEHGGFGHLYTYYEEMLHVPLIVRVPGEGTGRVVEAPVGLVDVMPTVLDVLGVEHELPLQGSSLRGHWRGTPPPVRHYLGEASVSRGVGALRTARYKYVTRPGGLEEAYDLESDPDERANLCLRDAELCRSLRTQHRNALEGSQRVSQQLALPRSEPARLDEKARQQLEALGYAEPGGDAP